MEINILAGPNGASAWTPLKIDVVGEGTYESLMTQFGALEINLYGAVYASNQDGTAGTALYWVNDYARVATGQTWTIRNRTGQQQSSDPQSVTVLLSLNSGVFTSHLLLDGEAVTFTIQDPLQSTVFESVVMCVAEGTLVDQENGSYQSVEQLRPGIDTVLGADGRPMNVMKIVRFPACHDFIDIRGILLRRGHPVLVGGREMPCELVPMARSIRTPIGLAVFLIATERREFIRVGGRLLVATLAAGTE
jgi:hypothetical protein